jgi:hypothetical protein
MKLKEQLATNKSGANTYINAILFFKHTTQDQQQPRVQN